MLKGVNKNIIEITDTGSDCFERAILFVRPEKAGEGRQHLWANANSYISSLHLRKGICSANRLWLAILKYSSAVAAGAGLAYLLLRL